MLKHLNEIDQPIERHENYRHQCLNLIASENMANPNILKYLTCDYSNRYGCYEEMDLNKREYPGNHYINQFEKETHGLILDVFAGNETAQK